MNTFEEIKPSRARKPPRQKGKDHFSDTPYIRPKEVRPSPGNAARVKDTRQLLAIYGEEDHDE